MKSQDELFDWSAAELFISAAEVMLEENPNGQIRRRFIDESKKIIRQAAAQIGVPSYDRAAVLAQMVAYDMATDWPEAMEGYDA